MENTLQCEGCGYALTGLPAGKCAECGHVYVRCPECGTTLPANEPQIRLLAKVRLLVMRIPRIIQVMQMAYLVVVGIIWVLFGFIFGSTPANTELLMDMGVLAWTTLFAAVCGFATRLIAFRLRSAARSYWYSSLFVGGCWTFPFVLAMTAGVQSSRLLRDAELVVLWIVLVFMGSLAGALTMPAIRAVGLWIVLPKRQRNYLAERHRASLKTSVIGGRTLEQPERHLAFCTHCAAEMPAMTPEKCPACELQRVQCPTCHEHSGTLPSLVAMQNADHALRQSGLVVLIVMRSVMFAVAAWTIGIMSWETAIHRGTGRIILLWAGSPLEADQTLGFGLLIACLRWLVWPGRSVWEAAGICSLSVAIAYVLAVQERTTVLGLAAIVGLAFGFTVAAAGVQFFIGAVLPRRRMAMVDAAMPQMAGESESKGEL